MEGRKVLKLKIIFATIGIILLAVVLWQFIVSDITAGKRSAGTFSVGLIICALIYGYVYLNFKSLWNTNATIVFSGFNVIQTVSVAFMFLIGTVMFTIFLPHFIIPSIGFALIAFTAYYGMNVIVFDYARGTVEGLLGSGKTLTFENLQVEFQDEQQLEIHASDSGEKNTLKREAFSSSSWIKIVENVKVIRETSST